VRRQPEHRAEVCPSESIDEHPRSGPLLRWVVAIPGFKVQTVPILVASPPIGKVRRDIATEKGERPPPESYLPPEYIAEHLRNFEDGASRILIRSDYEEYGVGKPDPGKSEFVLTKQDADAMITESGGDPAKLTQKLGIPADQLVNDSLVIIDFHPTELYSPQIPSGNEWGANKQWLPGGKLPKGDLEAIVKTDGMINGRDYSARDIWTGELL
jgi:hypothetical protein